MNIFNIEVPLNEEQTKTAIKHFDDVMVKNIVADIQGTVKSFFDKLAIEDQNEKKEKKEDDEN